MATPQSTDPNGIQPGFGFQPGQLIPNAPLIFPGEGQLFQLLEITAEYAGYFGYIGEIIAGIAEVILVILQLIDELVALFSGKPRAQDTLTVAKRLGRGQSPVAHLMSVQISRNLDQNNIVLSSSSAVDQAVLGAIRKQAELMLTQMGTPAARAKQVVDEVWTQTISGTQKLPVELNQPIPAGLLMVGPQQFQQDYINHYNSRIKQGFDPLKAGQLATNWVLQNSKLGHLGKIEIRPQPLIPIPGHLCPPGQHWDNTQQACVPDSLPPPPPPPPMQPCFPSPNPGQGDELDSLNCVAENLGILAYYVPYILQAMGGTGGAANPDPVTCAQLTAQVALITGELAQIAVNIANAPAGGGTPIDLTAVVTAISSIAASLDRLPGAAAANATLIADRLGGISRAISTAPGTDLTPLVKEIDKLFATIDVPLPVYQQLAADGWISSETLSQLGQGEFGTGIITAFKDYVTLGIKWIIGEIESGAAPKFAPVWKAEDGLGKFLAGIVDFTLNAAAVPFYPVVKGGIDGVATQLMPSQPPVIGDVFVNEDLLITKTLGPVLIMNSIMLVAGYFGWNTSEQLKEYVDVVSTVLGLEEVKEFTVGQRMAAGPVKQAMLEARALYRQELPGSSTLMGLVAQGLLNQNRMLNLIAYNGTPTELVPALLASSYRGFNARQMLRLIETGLFTQAEIQDELTFSAMRPVSQTRMLTAAPYLATAPQRSSLRGTLEKAALEGLLSDQELTSQIDSTEQNTDRDSLVLTRIHLEQAMATAKALETEYTNLFIGGVSNQAVFVSNLEGIGLQQWKVNNLAAVAESRATATAQRQATAAERALVRATDSEARRAAVKNFTSGDIDAGALTAALILTGLTVAQTAAWVDLAVLQKAGGLRWLYGLQLTPSQSILLRQRVSALTDQRKRLQITDAQFVDALKALKIPPSNINAIRAATDALITPKGSAVVIPVETS